MRRAALSAIPRLPRPALRLSAPWTGEFLLFWLPPLPCSYACCSCCTAAPFPRPRNPGSSFRWKRTPTCEEPGYNSCRAPRLGLQVHAAQKVFVPRVRAQWIEAWVHYNHSPLAYRAFVITLFQPLECLVLILKARINYGPVRRWNKLLLRDLVQLTEHLLRLC